MLQSSAKSTSGYSTGERSPKVANGACLHSLQSSLLKHKEENEGRRRTSHFGGKGDCICWCLAMNVKQQSYLSSKPSFSSTKFSFQSSDFLRWKRVRVALCYRNMRINVNTSASHTHFLFCFLYTAICFFVGCTLDHSLLRLPNTRTKLWSKKCVFWSLELSLTSAPLLAEEAHNNLGNLSFYFFLFLLN